MTFVFIACGEQPQINQDSEKVVSSLKLQDASGLDSSLANTADDNIAKRGAIRNVVIGGNGRHTEVYGEYGTGGPSLEKTTGCISRDY